MSGCLDARTYRVEKLTSEEKLDSLGLKQQCARMSVIVGSGVGYGGRKGYL